MNKQISGPLLDKLLGNVGDMALKRRARRIIEELELVDGNRVLDIGCGNGFYLNLLSQLGLDLQLTGVDNDSLALSKAAVHLKSKRASKLFRGKIELIPADAANLPFPSESFEKAILTEVVEHLSNEPLVLREVHRILTTDGILVLTTCNLNFPFLWDPVNWVLERVFNTHIKSGFWAGIWNQHLRLYEPESIKKIVEDAGFKLVTCQTLTSWCLPFNHYLVNLTARLFYADKLPKKIAGDFDKFKNTKGTIFGRTIFSLVNALDYLNDLFPGKSGVSIFIKARKVIDLND